MQEGMIQQLVHERVSLPIFIAWAMSPTRPRLEQEPEMTPELARDWFYASVGHGPALGPPIQVAIPVDMCETFFQGTAEETHNLASQGPVLLPYNSNSQTKGKGKGEDNSNTTGNSSTGGNSNTGNASATGNSSTTGNSNRTG